MFRETLSQIVAVSIKNLLLFEFGLTLGFPTILIPSLSSTNDSEDFYLDTESISWIGKFLLFEITFQNTFCCFLRFYKYDLRAFGMYY